MNPNDVSFQIESLEGFETKQTFKLLKLLLPSAVTITYTRMSFELDPARRPFYFL